MKFPKWWNKVNPRYTIGHPIIDHCIVKKDEDGIKQVLSRPYDFSMDELWNLMIKCKAHGIDFRICGLSDYNNATLTITFWSVKEKMDKQEYKNFLIAVKHNHQRSINSTNSTGDTNE